MSDATKTQSICRGSFVIGSACLRCSKCQIELAKARHAYACHDELVAALESLEWSVVEVEENHEGTKEEISHYCPSCSSWQGFGHADNCKLSAALKLAKPKE